MDRARTLFGISDELRDRLGREIVCGRHYQESGDIDQVRHGHYVLDVVDSELFRVEDRRNGVGADIAEHQRVAVGLRFRHFLDGQQAIGARLVEHDESLAADLLYAFADDARHNVRGAPRRIRHDDLNGRLGYLSSADAVMEPSTRQIADNRIEPNDFIAILRHQEGVLSTVGSRALLETLSAYLVKSNTSCVSV